MIETSDGKDPSSMRALAEIARWHRYVIWMILLQIIGTMAMYIASAGIQQQHTKPSALVAMAILLTLVLIIVTVVLSIYGVYKLALALSKTGILYAILMLIPYVALFTLLYLSSTATHTLQANGIKVGVMGASQAEVDRAASQISGQDDSAASGRL